ncbi:hypothetical protein ONZ51_g12361 [Trametes cubensis]|uniref:Uncharacterized protein n=1 Tax=Trametes cubensis TaxID=1111947 RepID=A0AAD7X5H4_9APHY|nr:hypothetical protein ONZ51_g12361 [Trametes cubensis]
MNPSESNYGGRNFNFVYHNESDENTKLCNSGSDTASTTIFLTLGSDTVSTTSPLKNSDVATSPAASGTIASSISAESNSANTSQDASSIVSFTVSEPITSSPDSPTTLSLPPPISTGSGNRGPAETSSIYTAASSIYTAGATTPTIGQPTSQSSSAAHLPASTTHVASIVGICFAVLIVLGIGALFIFQWRRRHQAKTAAKPYMTNRPTSLGSESFRALRLSGDSRTIPDMSIYPSLPPTLDVRTSTGIYNFPMPPSRPTSDPRATPDNANLLSLLISYYDARSPSRDSYVSQDESSLPSDIVDPSAEPMDCVEPGILPRASSEPMQRGCPDDLQTSLPSNCDLSPEEGVYCAI